MILTIGSTNPIKVQAVKEVVRDYSIFNGAEILSFSTPSGVSEQPLSIEEMIMGAKNRAKSAFLSCEKSSYAFGLESGLFKALGTQTGFLEACICSIYDGNNYYIGLSFQWHK